MPGGDRAKRRGASRFEPPRGLLPVAVLVCAATPLSAEQRTDEPDGLRREAPEIELELELEAERARAQESLDEGAREDTRLQGDLTLGLRQPLGARLDAFAEIELRSRRRFESREEDDDDDEDEVDDDVSLRLERLFLQHESADERRRWRLGRQQLDDAMGWLIDRELDGLRHTRRWEGYRLDLSFTRERWFEAGDEAREDIVYNALARLRIDTSGDSRWEPWLLHRSEREHEGSNPSEITWLGLQGIVRPFEPLRCWLNLAVRRGEEKRDDGDREIGGSAADAGVTWTLDTAARPAFTLGWARASGDGAGPDDNEDRFRQSGLHGNEFRLNGHNRFRYLGETLDPELTNLEVLTLGAGFRLGKRWSFDLAWHRYRQAQADDRLRGADIRYEPLGESVELGDALDLVVGHERGKRLDVLGVLGLFDPGAAFAGDDGDPDPAWVARLRVEWSLL